MSETTTIIYNKYILSRTSFENRGRKFYLPLSSNLSVFIEIHHQFKPSINKESRITHAPIFLVPGPPANIKASALTDESILVSWLPPVKPNGVIKSYTVYVRELGRVGQHTNYVVRADGHVSVIGFMYEVRSLKQHQLYEFWVSATTSVGEGEPTSIFAQDTISKAPSRIASFNQVIHKAVNSQLLLPCYAVGNPTPRTRWFHRDRPITFSPFYEVTTDGHLQIHSMLTFITASSNLCLFVLLYFESLIVFST